MDLEELKGLVTEAQHAPSAAVQLLGPMLEYIESLETRVAALEEAQAARTDPPAVGGDVTT